MSHLILVKHAMPVIDACVGAREWVLSDAGREASILLAERLTILDPDVIMTSVETKARQTAEILAGRLKKPLKPWKGLHEHDRDGVPLLGNHEFEEAVRSFFHSPSNLVFGNETAEQANARFETSVLKAVAGHKDRTIAVVAHGTVISLFAGKVAGAEPFGLWKRLELPSYVVFQLPGFELVDIVEQVA